VGTLRFPTLRFEVGVIRVTLAFWGILENEMSADPKLRINFSDFSLRCNYAGYPEFKK
jgi:hypothetical protein